MLAHKSLLQEVFEQVSTHVQREEFTKSLVTLGLLDPSQQGCAAQYSENDDGCSSHVHSVSSSSEKSDENVKKIIYLTALINLS